MQRAGIDLGIFSSHSTRSASASAAAGKGVPLDVILKAAGWRSDDVF